MAGRRKVSGLSLQRAGSVSAVHVCILQLYCVHEHDMLIQIARDFSGCPPPLPAAPGRLRGRCKLGSLLPMFSAVLQEMVVLVLDVGPRMHPHLEGAARAANDFVVSKVRSGAPLRLLHCGVLPSGPCCILHFARVTFSFLDFHTLPSSLFTVRCCLQMFTGISIATPLPAANLPVGCAPVCSAPLFADAVQASTRAGHRALRCHGHAQPRARRDGGCGGRQPVPTHRGGSPVRPPLHFDIRPAERSLQASSASSAACGPENTSCPARGPRGRQRCWP